MKKVNLLSKAEMKKVMGGNVPADDESGTCTCTNGKSHTCKHCSISDTSYW